MEEQFSQILPLEDHCKAKGIPDVEKFRQEMKPFRCIVKIRGVDYYSEAAYQAGIQEVFDKLRAKSLSTGKRQISEYSYHKRIVTSSPTWIEGKKQAIAKAEGDLQGLTDPDLRFKKKQELSKLRADLDRMEKAYASSIETLKKLMSDDGVEEQGA